MKNMNEMKMKNMNMGRDSTDVQSEVNHSSMKGMKMDSSDTLMNLK
jgi:hypothetical protein